MKKLITNVVGAGEIQKNAGGIITRISQSEEDVLVLKNNKPQVVMMSVGRYEKLKALEDLEFIPHRKMVPSAIRESFGAIGLYSKDFLDDLEEGLKKSSLYST